jgi:hypothetical protein
MYVIHEALTSLLGHRAGEKSQLGLQRGSVTCCYGATMRNVYGDDLW